MFLKAVRQDLVLTVKIGGAFAGSILIAFAVSLASEDQRNFVDCRAAGVSVDACLLQLNGR